MHKLKKYLSGFMAFFSDEEDLQEPKYDALHFGAVIILTLLGISVLFWLLWALMVFGGGLQSKVAPFLSIIFSSKTAADFGYIGYPYEMGVFTGWITNVTALFIAIFFVFAGYYLYNKTGKPADAIK